ncbi:MAG TPA: hypothetical protein VEQ63_13545 [Bryobacteraceae bacterium]|nr:hypothetical protein [Bryobacteraceae bacterium]
MTMWVNDRISSLDVNADWRPEVGIARSRLSNLAERKNRQRMQLTWAGATAALGIASLLAVPSTRAVAQRYWNTLVLNGVEVARFDADAFPMRLSLTGGQGVMARDPAEAEQIVGFRLHLPPSGVTGGVAKVGVMHKGSAQVTLDNGDLRSALDKAGASDVRLPADWNLQRLAVQFGPLVETKYSDVTLVQGPPVVLLTPADFSLAAFAEVAFRIGGIYPTEARTLGRAFAANPSWLIGIAQADSVTIRDVSLRSGPGILIEDVREQDPEERLVLVWSTTDRTFVLNGNVSAERLIAVANSVQ